MIEVNRKGEVWVFAEQEDESLNDVSLELVGRARQLADRLGVKVGAVLAGWNVRELSYRLIAHGVDHVYHVHDTRLEHYRTLPYARVMCQLIEKYKPQIVMYGATPIGRDLAPRIASELKAGLTADCTDLEIGDYTDPKSKQVHKDLLMQIRPAFGGNIIATIINYDRWPQMATVREGVMRMREGDPKRTGKIIEETIEFNDFDLAVKLIERHREARKVNLKAARIIVAGGGGVGSKENFQLIHDLAGALGGAVGASRAAVDGGFISKDHQVGQTGTTVRPALYVACGISGAVQHRAGMEESAKIIAINWDKDAPIFGVAHYGIVGDLNKVIPMMIKAIKERG
ncbi:MAG TPA: electron transfer flavoprotein subunit alpha/FixB family protein [Phycisphaerae bacterium]|jgi:electron transfer flavoprotein alpha subunit|nr:electron transfer flavoprotein subunit alpha/FixB family protein [Phycisphaerae bacterium]HOB74066.1 electron transfer flavoprotein subunit alpha/FixB family protein [Phycisphaerae bacterium]HOJ56492.1 electron transfer flavoprotein subunit alpha/FixB family protein [Phycisphaerae bacterium]HOL25408.1 electron transfer flavoprotein subunit alpha/FixB family protein [Phycisphaerae bacterium]HPP22084.1 electron transfer flavoprotein subunit alpha/FixB family protein [Phycisphaerae bacterium]